MRRRTAITTIAHVVLLSLLASCCWNTPSPPPCPTEKIQFTQDTGCLNDGSVEFCIPKDDPNIMTQVLAIAPNATFMNSGGRARCDTETQILCLVDVGRMCRSDTPDAMTDAGWGTVCELAGLPFVVEVVPTWYE